MGEVEAFIAGIENQARRADALALTQIMRAQSGYEAHLRGNIIGFGVYHYKYESGHEGEAAVVGFSPRKTSHSIYIMPGFAKYQAELALLGQHKLGKSCLYVNKLADIDTAILGQIIKSSVKIMQDRYDCRPLP